MTRLGTAESAYLNELSGDAQASLWERTEENPPGVSCEECLDYDWQLQEAGPREATWRCGRWARATACSARLARS